MQIAIDDLMKLHLFLLKSETSLALKCLIFRLLKGITFVINCPRRCIYNERLSVRRKKNEFMRKDLCKPV